jgi:hypothetical protein
MKVNPVTSYMHSSACHIILFYFFSDNGSYAFDFFFQNQLADNLGQSKTDEGQLKLIGGLSDWNGIYRDNRNCTCHRLYSAIRRKRFWVWNHTMV